MNQAILALNAGSSSFKFAVAAQVANAPQEITGVVERIGSGNSVMKIKTTHAAPVRLELGKTNHRAALTALFRVLEDWDPTLRITGVGHRIVHGGTRFAEPVQITPEIVEQIEALIPMAPLHQPHGLRGVLTAMVAFPDAHHIACFDSAFHARKPWLHDAYALPRRHYTEGLRRYGFHGIACDSICATLNAEGFPLGERKIVIAHLGNGCSVTAIQNGAPKATSMGFSTLDGLAMGTRCGHIDPGVLIHLMRQGQSPEDLERLLYHESGLIGLSGLSNDMRDLMASDDPDCADAIAFFTARLIEEIGRMACTMGGLDCVVFSGGIGENAGSIRDAVEAGLSFLPGRDGSGVTYLIRPADEEQQLITTVRQLAFGHR